MSGTKESGKRAAQTNMNLYGHDFYKRLGRMGGKASTGRGFANVPGLASRAGKLGGTISRRGNTPKPSKYQINKIRKRWLQSQSEEQTKKLSAKHGTVRPW